MTRAYVFGSSALRVSGDVVYIDANGKVEMRDLQIAHSMITSTSIALGKNLTCKLQRAWQIFNDPLFRSKGVELEFSEGGTRKFGPITKENIESFGQPSVHHSLAGTLVAVDVRGNLAILHALANGFSKAYSSPRKRPLPVPSTAAARRPASKQDRTLPQLRRATFRPLPGRDFVKFSAIGRSFR